MLYNFLMKKMRIGEKRLNALLNKLGITIVKIDLLFHLKSMYDENTWISLDFVDGKIGITGWEKISNLLKDLFEKESSFVQYEVKNNFYMRNPRKIMDNPFYNCKSYAEAKILADLMIASK